MLSSISVSMLYELEALGICCGFDMMRARACLASLWQTGLITFNSIPGFPIGHPGLSAEAKPGRAIVV